jgi:hypothetical protein
MKSSGGHICDDRITHATAGGGGRGGDLSDDDVAARHPLDVAARGPGRVRHGEQRAVSEAGATVRGSTLRYRPGVSVATISVMTA